MAIFDTNIGIIAIYEFNKNRENFYIDNLFSNYSMYSDFEVEKRVAKIYDKLESYKRIIVSDFNAVPYLYFKKNIEYGEKSLVNNLKGKKVLVLSSKSEKLSEFLKYKLESENKIVDVNILINAAADLLSPMITLKILDEYIEKYNLKDEYEYIFLANSSLHLIKDLIYRRFKNSVIVSNVDFILNDYYYIKENRINDNFYVSGDKKDFYTIAERYLKNRKSLENDKYLHVNSFKV